MRGPENPGTCQRLWFRCSVRGQQPLQGGRHTASRSLGEHGGRERTVQGERLVIEGRRVRHKVGHRLGSGLVESRQLGQNTEQEPGGKRAR